MSGNRGKGRPKGSQNKIKTAASEIADKLGINPLEVLLYFAANDWESLDYDGPTITRVIEGQAVEIERISPETRLNAAKEAVKYMYPTQKAVEFTGEVAPFKIVIEDYGTKK